MHAHAHVWSKCLPLFQAALGKTHGRLGPPHPPHDVRRTIATLAGAGTGMAEDRGCSTAASAATATEEAEAAVPSATACMFFLVEWCSVW